MRTEAMTVDVFAEGKELTAEPGQTLFACATAVGVRVPTSCFEQGKCRECLVELEEGEEHLSERTPEEEHLDDGFRLSCRARVAGTGGTIRFRTMRRGALRIVESGTVDADTRLDPVDPDGKGVALDVGTTTVVARLVDLETGRTLATQSFENPQRFGGSDVMARIRHDTENKGRLLQRTLLGYLTHCIETFPCEPGEIREVVVAGNTTMRDLFFGLNVEPIGVRPYRSVTEAELRDGARASTSLEASPKKLRLPIHPDGRVYGLPLVSGHVGADAAAGVLATGIARGARPCVFMDIGTNTELVVGNRDKLMAASCPAGPAFEGGKIARGMPALTGAVERVRLLDDGTVELVVIGGGAPEGVCGSGLVDAMGELLRTGRMNEQGRFDDELEGRFTLDEASDVYLSEADVNELAQAKGANVAGLRLLLREYGITLDQVERVYLAGGFARHLDLDAARRVGLIPDLPDERFAQVGNTALEGATLALKSVSMRRELEELVKTIVHVELETQPDFFDAFVDGCQFVRFGGEGPA